MTTNKCPTPFECPEILRIIAPCLSIQKNVLDDDIVEKVITTCRACIEPPYILVLSHNMFSSVRNGLAIRKETLDWEPASIIDDSTIMV